MKVSDRWVFGFIGLCLVLLFALASHPNLQAQGNESEASSDSSQIDAVLKDLGISLEEKSESDPGANTEEKGSETNAGGEETFASEAGDTDEEGESKASSLTGGESQADQSSAADQSNEAGESSQASESSAAEPSQTETSAEDLSNEESESTSWLDRANPFFDSDSEDTDSAGTETKDGTTDNNETEDTATQPEAAGDSMAREQNTTQPDSAAESTPPPPTLDELLREARSSTISQRELLISRLNQRQQLAGALKNTLDVLDQVADYGEAGIQLLQQREVADIIQTLATDKQPEPVQPAPPVEPVQAPAVPQVTSPTPVVDEANSVAESSDTFEDYRPVYATQRQGRWHIGFQHRDGNPTSQLTLGQSWRVGEDVITLERVQRAGSRTTLTLTVNDQPRELVF